MKITRSLAIILTTFALVAGVAFAQKKSKDESGSRTFTGEISDSMCTTNHMLKEMKAGNVPECVRKCVKDSFDYALVVGKDYYILKGKPEEFDKYAGQKVTVKGSLKGDTLTAESVTPAPATGAKTAKRKKKT